MHSGSHRCKRHIPTQMHWHIQGCTQWLIQCSSPWEGLKSITINIHNSIALGYGTAQTQMTNCRLWFWTEMWELSMEHWQLSCSGRATEPKAHWSTGTEVYYKQIPCIKFIPSPKMCILSSILLYSLYLFLHKNI